MARAALHRLGLGLGLGLLGCGADRGPVPPAPAAAAPARPAGCREVAAGAALQPLLDEAATTRGALCLAPGEYRGPLVLRGPVTLWGTRKAVIRSAGEGTTVRLAGAGARLLGVTIDGSGGRYDRMDAGVEMQGEDLLVEGVRVQRGVFGVLMNRSRRAALRSSEIIGSGDPTIGLRGDGVRLWETTDSAVEGNYIHGGRDVVARYSHRNRITGNTVQGGRYGLHLMYCHDVLVQGNRSIGNVVGAFIMYSRGARVRGNLLAASAGAAGIGLGVKESGNLLAEDNLILRNTIGAYFDTSPLYVDEHNLLVRNAIRLSDTAVVFHSSQLRNIFRDNSLRDNLRQVRVEGGGDALGVRWEGNDWGDYAGYDLDRDGYGDVPYELRSLSSQLTAAFPDLDLFRGAPALMLLDAVSHILPLFQPRLLVRDPRPRAQPLALPMKALHAD